MRSTGAIAGFVTGLVALVCAEPVLAQSAPSALRGKSITVGWTENRMQRREGGANFRPRSVSETLQIYVSSEGRTFQRRNTPGASREGVGTGVVGRGGGSTKFQGSSLVIAGVTRSGARMVVVTFDAGFTGCSARVSVGHEAGTNIIKGNSMRTRRPIEFMMEGVTGQSCSIQSGNVFAQ